MEWQNSLYLHTLWIGLYFYFQVLTLQKTQLFKALTFTDSFADPVGVIF